MSEFVTIHKYVIDGNIDAVNEYLNNNNTIDINSNDKVTLIIMNHA